jgi:AraC family L-rhamnose operon transcriptional activator RhaR
LDDRGIATSEKELRALYHDCDPRGLRSRVIGRLLLVLGIIGEHLDSDTVTAISRALYARPWLADVAALLRESYNQPWRLEQLAARFGVYPNHLARSFKAAFGLAPISYLTYVRAEVAATLLLQTDLSIAEIGADVGWPDPNYFARRFRAHFGASPSSYRLLNPLRPEPSDTNGAP